MKTLCNLTSASLHSLFILPWLLGVLAVHSCFSATTLQIGDATVKGTLTIASGATFSLASGSTFNLPADVTRLGSSISLTSEVAGILPIANGGSGTATPSLVAGTNVTISGTWPNQTITSSGSGGGGTGGDLLATLLSTEVSVTTTATLTPSIMHVCSGTTANYTVTLPAASGNAGKLIGVRMAASLTKFVTLAGSGSEQIDGSNTRVMWAKESAILLCDGTGWTKIAGRSVAMLCVAYPTANATVPNGGSGLDVDLNAAITDLSGMLSSSRIVIRRSGTYQLNGAVRYDSLGSNVNFLVSGTYLTRGGSTTPWITQTTLSALAGCVPHIYFGAPFSLLAGDLIALHAFQGSGGALTLLGSSSPVTEQSWCSVIEIPSW